MATQTRLKLVNDNGKVCSACGVYKDLSCFYWHKAKALHRSTCKECDIVSAINRHKRRLEADPNYTSDRHLVEKYGITFTCYKAMLIGQNYKCAACGGLLGTAHKGSKHHPVDHCHETGKIRGIIHSHCNHALGHVKDDPVLLMKLAKYLLIN